MTDTAFTWDDLDTSSDDQSAATPTPVEAVETPLVLTKKTAKKRTPKPAQTAQTEKRSKQVKFYITDAELVAFNELRGAVPASAFLYSAFQELLK